MIPAGGALLDPVRKHKPRSGRFESGLADRKELLDVIENQEPLRKVAKDYGVSYETVRRVILVTHKQRVG